MTNTDVTAFDNARSAVPSEMLAEISDFASALSALENAGVAYNSISDYGTGFTVIDKEKVVGVPFVVVEWRFNASALNDDGFVSAAIVTKHGDKFIINDGSSGMRKQFREITDRRNAAKHPTPQNGLLVPGGLTVSNYEYEDSDGKRRPARTYYLDERATVK